LFGLFSEQQHREKTMRARLQTLHRQHGILALAVLLTLLLRLVYGLVIFEQIADRFSWRQDDEYPYIASTLVSAGKYAVSEDSPPTMKRLPVHPLFLAGIYALFGRSALAVRIVQSFVCAATCILVYVTAREVSNRRVAQIAALIFAVYPNSILYSARALSETTCTFLLGLFCFALVRMCKSPRLRTAIAAGIPFDLLVLTKGTAILLPPFLLLALLSRHYRRNLWRMVGSMVLVMLTAALFLLPWSVRNYRLSGKVVVLSTWGGARFYHGYYVATHLAAGHGTTNLDREAAQEARRLIHERYTPTGQAVDEYHEDRIAYSLVGEEIQAMPFHSAWIFLRNLLLAWFLTYGQLTTAVSLLVHVPLLLFSLAGIVIMYGRDRHTWIRSLPLLLVLAYFNLVHAVVYPHVRYMFPAIATVSTILAAYGIWRLWPLAHSLFLQRRLPFSRRTRAWR
jgi:4-amino-4-deoxy-L-arabinose transferase-like glycosyltransferase